MECSTKEGEDVREKLDKAILEVMESLKQLSSLRNKYNHAIKEGYFAMTQARHAMGGPRHVCSLQYDSVMKPLVKLHIKSNADVEEIGGCSYNELTRMVPAKETLQIEFKVDRMKPGEVRRVKDDIGDHVTTRRRIKGEEAGSIEDVTKTEVLEELKDPIKWFGILVPQNLRRSQQHFVQVINYSIELAAAQMRFEVAHRSYQELLAKKSQQNH